ncbi:hypothetical protein [Brucella anthropi]|uniref:hypothetical protein n=1 Tax=Brucella anthropi TaxID=529 RepID=UPI0039889322
MGSIEARIANTASRTSETLAGHSEAFAASVADNLAGTEARLNERASAIASGLEAIESRLTGELSTIESRIADTASKTSETLAGHSETFSASVADNLAGTEARLAERADAIATRLGDIGSRITMELGSVEARIAQVTDTTAVTLEERTRELNAVLAARSQEITKILNDTAEPLVQRLADSGRGLAQQLEEATHAATDRLRSENAALVNALASRTAETIAAVQQAKTGLADNVSELIDRLAASNGELGKLIDAATRNLTDIDGRLVDTTSSFVENTNRAAQMFQASTGLIDSNIGTLRSLSDSTLSQIADIADRFEEHGKVLASASDMINTAQNGLVSTLEDRHQALDKLASGLVEKSEGVERLMQSFEELVTSAFQRAEGQTRSSAEKMRESVSEIVEQAAQKFSAATDDIRRTASEIRNELNTTRGELKRGVLDMPAEAKETTTAMRKAVSEQINALKELAEIVNKSGRLVDVGESRADRPVSRPAPVAAVRPAPVQAPAADVAVRQRAYEAPKTQPAQAATQAEKPRGWVSDLLARASREEEEAVQPKAQPTATPRSPSHVVESLNSLSVDIARAIDHEASVELWDRYRRGERNVFTRRLYTLKGQQTFDDIKRKYQTDSEFRRAVDRYMDDFQRLLEDVARNDRDNMVTRTYLTSDTGKVYTMLAHASGRLR